MSKCKGRLRAAGEIVKCNLHDTHEEEHVNGLHRWYNDRPGAYFEGETKTSGKRDEFTGGGVRDAEQDKPRFDLLMPERVPYDRQYLTRVARLMARGASHYEDRNWEKFDDEAALNRAKSSAFRHFMQWFNGETDEDHAAAVYFNVQTAEYIKGRINGEW